MHNFLTFSSKTYLLDLCFHNMNMDACISLGHYFILACLIVLNIKRKNTVFAFQAEKGDWNSIAIFKVSNISGKRCELVPKKSNAVGSDMEEDSESDSDSEDEVDVDLGHQFCICARLLMKDPHICASWADTDHVQVWDFSSHLNALAESESELSHGGASAFNQAPLVKYLHKDEGYAIDWSAADGGTRRLLSGGCNNNIHLWTPSGETWNVDTTPFIGHTASVEDIQWSPTECSIFTSCSVDRNIAIWGICVGKSPAVSFMAHNADVNVMSWNRIWDLSLEKDEEEEAEFKAKTKEQVHARGDLPPQLLFVHQKDLKELHWHAQIPGMLVSTAADVYNILMPSNIQKLSLMVLETAFP